MAFLEISFWQMLVSQFKHTSLFEWAGLSTTLICIYLAARENIWNWPVSIASVVISGIIYFENRLYGDFALQFYFLFTAFYGWYYWLKKKKEDSRPIVRIHLKSWAIVITVIVLLSYLLGLFLKKYTNTNVPFEDGFCTAMSFVAQIMLTRKILENWILWVIVNICYVPLFIYKSLNLYALLYTVLIILAFKGYIDWKKAYREQTH